MTSNKIGSSTEAVMNRINSNKKEINVQTKANATSRVVDEHKKTETSDVLR